MCTQEQTDNDSERILSSSKGGYTVGYIESHPLLRCFRFVGKNSQRFQGKVLTNIERVIKIFGDRAVYKQQQIDELSVLLVGNSSVGAAQEEQERLLREYENNIDGRMNIRNKAFSDAIELIRVLMDPPSADQHTRFVDFMKY